MNQKLKIGVLIGALAALSISYAEVFVVVHQNSPLQELSSQKIKRIYLNRKKTWDHGGIILKTTLNKHQVHKEFCSRFLSKNPKRFERFWLRIVFTGEGEPPKSISTEEELLEFIAAHENALGYVSKKPDHNGVRVIKVD